MIPTIEYLAGGLGGLIIGFAIATYRSHKTCAWFLKVNEELSTNLYEMNEAYEQLQDEHAAYLKKRGRGGK